MDADLFGTVTRWSILLLTICVILLCGYFYHNYNYWKRRGVPYKKPFLVFGNLEFALRKSFWDFCYELKERHPREYVGIFLAWRPALLVQTPELARRILVTDHVHFEDRFLYSRKSDPLGTLNLFTLKQPLWSVMRHKISPMFTTARLRNFTKLMNVNASELVKKIRRDYIDNKKSVDLKELFTMYTSDTVAYTAFGIQVSALNDQESPLSYITSHMVKWSFWRGFEITMIFLVPAIAALLRLCFFSAAATEYITKIFWNVVNQRNQLGNSNDKDLVNYLLKLKENLKLPADADSSLADNLMLAQAAVFLLGAIETSSTTLSLTLHELSYNPEAQEKLYIEVKNAVKNSENILEYEELLGLKYLSACIIECLRKHPPVPYIDRICNRKYKLNDNLTIEREVPVFVNVVALHYDEKVYPEPEKYRPERMYGSTDNDNYNFNFIPFGEGPRFCIGKRYGMMQVRAALAQIILHYRLEPAVPYAVKTDPYSIVLSPDNGGSVKFVPR